MFPAAIRDFSNEQVNLKSDSFLQWRALQEVIYNNINNKPLYYFKTVKNYNKIFITYYI